MVSRLESDLFDTFIEEIEFVNTNNVQNQQNIKNRSTGAIPKNSSPPSRALSTKQAEHLPKNFKTVVELINNGLCVCVILRGLPGSGKSFLADRIIEETVKNPEGHVLSADKFFINRGQYKFKAEKLPEAHDVTQKLFAQRASQGASPLIVDNTNTSYWEMYYYLQVAVQYGYVIEIMEPQTPWKFAEGKLVSKNQHSVPIESIKRMKERYETGVSLEHLLKSLNLDIVREPKMRSIPPLVPETVHKSAEEPVRDLIDLGQQPSDGFQWKLYNAEPKQESLTRPSDWQTVPQKKIDTSTFNWNPPPQVSVVESDWGILNQELPKANPSEKPKKNDSQTQKKQRKNKPNRSPQSKLSPHRQNCPNENQTFSRIRELYPDVKDSYLWDFFEKCKGDAEWCVNLLCDENLVDLMDAGSDLTCNCFAVDVTRAVANNGKGDESPKPQQQPLKSQSPLAKPKVTKGVAKQIDLEDWLSAKESIEKSITIGAEHYPDHVKSVKNWKKGPQKEPSEPLISDLPDSQKTSSSPDASDELHALTIADDLILELDEEYGGGLLKEIMDVNHKFPSKIFIKKSTAHQLYLEIMEAYYGREEEARLLTLKKDEELAKQLSEQPELPSSKSSKKNGGKEAIEMPAALNQYEVDIQNNWRDEETSDDLALKMSKEKLIEMFPGLNKSALMEIFAGANHNFQETVTFIQDSLNCSPQERKEIAQVQKKVFNTRWQQPVEAAEDKFKESDEAKSGYTSEHLKTVEDLRQEIKDHQEEQQVCYNKARDAIQKKNYEIASYLSNIAKFHKQKADEAKHKVANMMVGIHEKTHASDTTLDLHYLNLVEAATLLDTFLDRNISRLRAIKKPYEEIHIITGRGLHSANGVASIKNKTKSRLRERNLS